MRGISNNSDSVEMQPFSSVLRGVIMRLILAEKENPSEMKSRIMIAREHGHLTDAETTEMIRTWDLRSA